MASASPLTAGWPGRGTGGRWGAASDSAPSCPELELPTRPRVQHWRAKALASGTRHGELSLALEQRQWSGACTRRRGGRLCARESFMACGRSGASGTRSLKQSLGLRRKKTSPLAYLACQHPPRLSVMAHAAPFVLQATPARTRSIPPTSLSTIIFESVHTCRHGTMRRCIEVSSLFGHQYTVDKLASFDSRCRETWNLYRQHLSLFFIP